MKNLLSLFIALILSAGTVASAKGVQYEGVLGMNIADLDASPFSSRVGFHIGVRGTYAFQRQSKGAYVNGAALLSLKGAETHDVTFSPFYLEIPIHIGYKHPIASNVAIFGEFGPYFGIGLFGQADGHNVFSDEVGFERFDAGLGLRVGFEFSRKFNAAIGYDFGLTDAMKHRSAKNTNVTISVGYKF